jgi:CBS domain-containing protein
MKVHDVMTQPPQICLLATDLATARRRMRDADTGMLVVLDARGRVAGVVTDRDLALAIGDARWDARTRPVKTVMSRPAHCCSPDEELAAVLPRLARNHVRRLPVIDADGDLKGVLSIDDVVLWAVHRGGVTQGTLVSTLRRIVAPHAAAAHLEPAEG